MGVDKRDLEFFEARKKCSYFSKKFRETRCATLAQQLFSKILVIPELKTPKCQKYDRVQKSLETMGRGPKKMFDFREFFLKNHLRHCGATAFCENFGHIGNFFPGLSTVFQKKFKKWSMGEVRTCNLSSSTCDSSALATLPSSFDDWTCASSLVSGEPRVVA